MSDYERKRTDLVDQLIDRGYISEPRVIEALRSVPRHRFVPAGVRDRAYADRPLPIGDGQTISAPHMVGLMTELLELSAGDRVLEIGTGCGYHAAVVAEITGDGTVYTIEYSESLATKARNRLAELGYELSVRAGDGSDGWPANAPYDAIYLTCAPETLPEPLQEQVITGGRIVAPLGRHRQELYAYTKTTTGLDRESHGPVRFVPMRGSVSG